MEGQSPVEKMIMDLLTLHSIFNNPITSLVAAAPHSLWHIVDAQCIIAKWKNEFNLKGIHFIFSAATPLAWQQPSQHIILIIFLFLLC